MAGKHGGGVKTRSYKLSIFSDSSCFATTEQGREANLPSTRASRSAPRTPRRCDKTRPAAPRGRLPAAPRRRDGPTALATRFSCDQPSAALRCAPPRRRGAPAGTSRGGRGSGPRSHRAAVPGRAGPCRAVPLQPAERGGPVTAFPAARGRRCTELPLSSSRVSLRRVPRSRAPRSPTGAFRTANDGEAVDKP